MNTSASVIPLPLPSPPAATQRAAEPDQPTDQPTVLRCKNTADLLAALPFLAGFTAENSMFVVLFQGRRAGNVIRFDLPDDEHDETIDPLIEALVQMLRDTGSGRQAPAIVLVTGQSFARTGSAPWGRFAKRVRRRFNRELWQLREFAVVGANGWADLLGEQAGVRRPLSEIAASAVADEAAKRVPKPQSRELLTRLPAPDPERAEQIAKHLRELERRRQSRSAHPAGNTRRSQSGAWMHGTARVAGACFGRESDAQEAPEALPDPRVVARLIEAAQTSERWSVLALTALTRVEFVTSVADECESVRFADLPVDIDGSSPGRAPAGPGWSLRRLLHSLSYEAPEAHKLRHAIDAAASAAAHAPIERRPGLLALVAWAWWSLGMQSVCASFVEQSLAIDPEHELTRMVARLNEAPPEYRILELQRKFAA